MSRGAARADPGGSRRSGWSCAPAAVPVPSRRHCTNQDYHRPALIKSPRAPREFAGFRREFAQFSAASRRRSSPGCAIASAGFTFRWRRANKDPLKSAHILKFPRIPLQSAGFPRQPADSCFNAACFSTAWRRPSDRHSSATFDNCTLCCFFAGENSLNYCCG